MKKRAYIDIETTGLSRREHDITVVGIAIETDHSPQVVQLVVNQINDTAVMQALEGVDEIYSYNGNRFDLEFINIKLRTDLRRQFKHTDLMYNCLKQGLKGGLKNVEKLLGIDRRLKDINGYMAVVLWNQYVKQKDSAALETLLEYNKEDIVNLIELRKKLGVE